MAKAIDEKYLSVKVAKETTIYYISNKNEDISKMGLLKHIMRSTEKIKNIKFNKRKYNIFINGELCKNPFAFDPTKIAIIKSIELCKIDDDGNKDCINSFVNIEDACTTLFEYVYKNVYLNDKNKLRECYFTLKEAVENFYVYYAEKNNLSIDESKSILKENWLQKVENKEKEYRKIKLMIEKKERLILSLINLIHKIENETLEQTAKRLSVAIGSTIDKDILFDAARRIREE